MPQVIDTEWSETWQPTDEAIGWAQSVLSKIADGGTLVIPRSMHIYTVSHARKILALTSGDPNDVRNWHRKNVRTFKRLGYAVLDGTPETAVRN